MASILNQPTEETQVDIKALQERIALALEDIAETKTYYDYTNSPGPKMLAVGSKEAGVFGFVQSSELISGDTLATDLGLTAGTSFFSDSPWIKYVWKGVISFVPLKPFRYSIPWNSIYDVGAVYGTEDEGTLPPNGRLGVQLSILASDNSINTTGDFLNPDATVGAVGETLKLTGWDNGANNGEFTIDSITSSKIVLTGGTLVDESNNRDGKIYNIADMVTQNAKTTIDGVQYRVALMKGGGEDPLDSYADSDRGALNGNNEWNEIILPMHERAKTQDWNYSSYAGTTEYFGFDLSDEDLRTHNKFGPGSYTWCQETRDDSDTFRRVGRGYRGASHLSAASSWGTGSAIAWRPRLSVIG